MIFRNLSEQEKTDKAQKNKASRTTNSEGIIPFLSKKIAPYTRIIDISRRSIAIGIQREAKAATLVINIYAPATKTENKINININININIDLLISYKVHRSLSKGTHLTAFALIVYGR